MIRASSWAGLKCPQADGGIEPKFPILKQAGLEANNSAVALPSSLSLLSNNSASLS